MAAIGACNAAFGVGDLAFDAATAGSAGGPAGGSNAGGLGGSGGEGGAAHGGGGGGAGGAGGGGRCLSCGQVLEDSTIDLARVPNICGYVAFNPPDLECEPNSSCSLLDALVTCACVTSCSNECASAGCQGGPISAACQTCFEASCIAELDACNADL
jgi:hypothetical protein